MLKPFSKNSTEAQERFSAGALQENCMMPWSQEIEEIEMESQGLMG